MKCKLYSNQKVINFIEITTNPEPSIDKNLYSVITLNLDSDNYLHYSYKTKNESLLFRRQ